MPSRRVSIALASPKPLRTTSAFSAARARAMARPIPLVEPVTIATLPFSMVLALAYVGMAASRPRDAAPQQYFLHGCHAAAPTRTLPADDPDNRPRPVPGALCGAAAARAAGTGSRAVP